MYKFIRSSAFDDWLMELKDRKGKARILARLARALVLAGALKG
jgi:putative component of toxin-antitoxin plasmid stabilization module